MVVALLGVLLMVYMHRVLQLKYIHSIWQEWLGRLLLGHLSDLSLRETLKAGVV